MGGLPAVVAALAMASCGGRASTPQATLHAFLSDWSRGDWARMRTEVATPTAAFTTVNAAAFVALGVKTATFTAGPVHRSGGRARARVVEHYTLPRVGAWSPSTTVALVSRNGRWQVDWSPSTIAAPLRTGDRLATVRSWPHRAPILGAGGVPLTTARAEVVVGVVGSRIKEARAVGADLVAAGATRAEVAQALGQAKAHPGFFDPVLMVSRARYEQLKAQPGPTNVYAVPGTQFKASASRTAITAQLAAHVVGTVGPVTADELGRLGSPYLAGDDVGQTGLEAQYERTLAGTPRTRIEVHSGPGATLATLAGFPGTPGRAVTTSLDPRVQRAAESALSGLKRTVAMVAMRASTGQLLAVVSDPAGGAYDQALQGEYPPGSTFKVLTATALFQAGLSPASPAGCPPTLTVDGEVFRNAEGDQPVQTIDQAFTESCNTAFIALALAHLHDFRAAASLYGLDRVPHPGLPAFDAIVPAPTGRTALAAAAIGQGGVLFSPLGMATVAAAVDSGSARPPRLVSGAADDRIAATPLPAAVVNGLQTMMANVVAGGTAAGTGLPPGTHAKTGTAEVGTGSVLRIDAWLMGYDGDIAFGIVVPDSGGTNGGPEDGPLIARFLNALSGPA